MTNFYQGLARGPIDHNASSVINVISNSAIQMGDIVKLESNPISSTELLPRVRTVTTLNDTIASAIYGVCVGGDADGVYPTDGVRTGLAANAAATGAGQGVVIVTQGRCLANVAVEDTDTIVKDEELAFTDIADGAAGIAQATGQVIARALQETPTASGGTEFHVIAVDVQREGIKA